MLPLLFYPLFTNLRKGLWEFLGWYPRESKKSRNSISPAIQVSLGFLQVGFPGRDDLDRARFEFGNFRFWIQGIDRQQIRGGFREMEGDKDHAGGRL